MQVDVGALTKLGRGLEAEARSGGASGGWALGLPQGPRSPGVGWGPRPCRGQDFSPKLHPRQQAGVTSGSQGSYSPGGLGRTVWAELALSFPICHMGGPSLSSLPVWLRKGSWGRHSIPKPRGGGLGAPPLQVRVQGRIPATLRPAVWSRSRG